MKIKLLQHKFNMKWGRVISLIVLLLAFTSGAKSNPIDVRTANKAAWSFLNAKMGSCPQINLIEFAEKASFSNLYVFGNDHCFVIIAADDCVHPVLGYSTENAFGMEEMPENIHGWLQAYNENITLVVNSKKEVSSDIKAEWDNLLSGRGLEPKTRTSVAPLVKTTWNQTAPYNNLCPADPENDSSWYNGHVPTGCVATAMAQLMNYWEHPVRGFGSHSYIPVAHPEYGEQYADFGTTIYDWDNMKNSYSDGYIEEEAIAVATLMYHCGVALEMDYTSDGSGAVSQYTPNALTNYFDYEPTMSFKYKSSLYYGDTIVSYTDDAWIRLLKTELNAERPMIYRGAGGSSGGHAFICDGYDDNDYFHFNWGWGGRYNGFFVIGALCPGEFDFSYFDGALIGCKPNVPSINPPTNVSTNVEGRDVCISWVAAQDAVSYKLYRDGELIVNNLSNTNYTDRDLLYGTYSYYVKSVAVDGSMSLRSEISTVEITFPGPVPTNLQATMNNHNVNLSWIAPVSEDVTLNYGNGNTHWYWPSSITYYAHRYLANDLVLFPNKRVSKVETYISSPGTYTIYVFTNSTLLGKPEETSLAFVSNPLSFGSMGWHEVVLNDPVIISGGTDLWVVIKQEVDTGVSYPIPSFDLTEYNANACYRGYSSPTELSPISTDYPISWFINVYLTDGTYTYNLYRNRTRIADGITGTTYQDNNLPDDHYMYYVTTNYFGGESEMSNNVEIMIGNSQYTISASANPSTGGSVSGGGTFGYGQTCTLIATPNSDYIFLNWTEDGEVVSTNSTYSFLTENHHNLTANFVPLNYLISVSSSVGGSVSGGGTYQYGQTCTLVAVPIAGYIFTDWTKDGETVYFNTTFSFAVTENATYTANFTKAQTGILNGLFSVGDSKQVRFSQGNLQYQASTNIWRFAENQLSIVGGSNSGNVYEEGVLCNNELIANDYDGWIDLFGWGTSGYDHGAVCYQPWSISTENSYYFAYNNTIFNLFDETGLADWGANSIENGRNTPNYWRTLKAEEWQYLFDSRPGIRYAKAKVNNLNGVVLLPDNWDESIYNFNNPNEGNVPFLSNVITTDDWSILETEGAVFLPMAGIRHENSVSLVGNYCGYWSSSRFDRNNNCACCVLVYNDYISHTFHYRNNGYAVRLVSDYSDVTQTYNMSEGPNWFSTYLDITLDDLKAALVAAIPANTTVTIKNATQNTLYSRGQWNGTLDWDVAKMYKIIVPTACEMTLEGMPLNPAEHPITIVGGGVPTWIGFPFSESMTLTNAFAGFAQDGDIVKSSSDNAQYARGLWNGQVTVLEPGKGYLYISAPTAADRTLIFPTGSK